MNLDGGPRILVVCRGSADHGLGHVMRARTVATCLARKHAVRLVALGDPEILTPLVRGRGFPFEVTDDSNAALAAFRQDEPELVAFDATDFPVEPFQEMKRRAMVASLSPAFTLQPHVDLVFHRTRSLTKELAALGPNVALRRGLDYVVLRESCRRIPEDAYARHLEGGPLAVAISMGGVDAGNNSLRLLTSLAQLPQPLLIWVLLGEGYAHSYQALVDCVSQTTRHEIILAKTTDSLWRVMETCSVGILAGGITTYEAAFAGLPSINILQNDRGPALVQELVERGVGLSAGPPFVDAVPRVNELLANLEQNHGELLAMHQRTRGLIDGRGAERIAEELVAFWRDEYRRGGRGQAA